MAKKQSSVHAIESFNDSWEVNPKDGLPQSGAQVRTFLGEQISGINGRIDHLEEEVANGTVDFRFTSLPSGNVIINGNQPYQFPFAVRSMLVSKDGTEEEFDQNVFIEITVTNGSNTTNTLVGSVRANEPTSIDIAPYVFDGCYFTLRAYNESGNTKRSSSYGVTKATVEVTTLGNAWWTTPYVSGTEWNIPLHIDTNVNATLRAKMLDAEGIIRSSKTIPSAQLSENYNLTMQHPTENGGESGIYTLVIDLVATDEYLNGLKSDTLEYTVCCIAANDDKNYLVINNRGTAFKNYVTNRMFDYVLHVGYGNQTIRFVAKEGDNVIADTGSMSAVSDQLSSYNLSLDMERLDDADFHITVTAIVGEGEEAEPMYGETFTFSNKDGYAATAGATMFIRFNGRSNAETARETFYNAVNGEAVTPELTNIGFTGADGYRNETLQDGSVRTVFRMLAGSRMVLPIKPLAMRPTEGRTIEFLYKVNNVRDFDSTVISCKEGKNGLTINSNEISLFTPSAQQHDDQNAGVDYTDTMHAIIVVRPQPNGTDETVDNFSACQIYLNGCRQRWFAYNRDLNVDAPITFGSDFADIDVIAVRTYDKVLSDAEIEQNTCNLLPTEAEKNAYKTRNAVRENGRVDFNRVRSLCNVIVFGCDELPSRSWTKEQTTNATIEMFYRDGTTQNVSVENFAWQGTTSHNYGTNAEFGGLGQNYKWTTPDGEKMCAKANWASSMQSHKIALTAAYTDLAIACGLIPATQRISILQRPMVGFQRKSDGTLTCIGLFTVGADKGDKGTFGWTSKSLFMEGKDNEPLGTNFILPWNDDTVTVDSTNETYSLCGVKAWEDASKKPQYINDVWKPAYNFVHGCMQRILPFDGTDMASANLNTSYSYWLTSGSGKYDLYYYNETAKAWMASGINLGSLIDGGYGLTASDLEGKTNDEINTLFKEARKAKFKAEIEQHFSTDFALYHICFIEFFGCTDNFSKNTYPFVLDCTADDKRVCWRQDDLDSALMTENQGKNYKKYCVEISDNYAEYGRDNLMVFNGTDNQFWLLIRECFAKEIETYMREKFIPALKYGQSAEPMTMYAAWCKHYFFDNAQNHFPEALYNETGKLRYGYGHLSNGYQYRGIALSQDSGNCYYAEKQWLRMRYIYMTSKYTCGNFAAGSKTDVFTTRPYTAEDGVGNTFEITPAIYMYPSVQNGESVIRGTRIYPGYSEKSWSVTLPPTQGDQEQRINGMSYITSLGAMYNAAIRGNVDVNGKMLQQLEIGTLTDTEHIRSRVTGIGIGDATSLQELTLANVTTLSGVVDLADCTSLQKVYADNTSVTNVQLCDGGNLDTLHLPATITNLSLVGKNKLADLTMEGAENLTSIEVQNCNEYVIGKVLEVLTDIYE